MQTKEASTQLVKNTSDKKKEQRRDKIAMLF